jgi:hypothetical protein
MSPKLVAVEQEVFNAFLFPRPPFLFKGSQSAKVPVASRVTPDA